LKKVPSKRQWTFIQITAIILKRNHVTYSADSSQFLQKYHRIFNIITVQTVCCSWVYQNKWSK